MELHYKQTKKDFYKLVNKLKSEKGVINQVLVDRLGFRDISHFMTFIQKAYIKPEDMQRIIAAIDKDSELVFVEKPGGIVELKLIKND